MVYFTFRYFVIFISTFHYMIVGMVIYNLSENLSCDYVAGFDLCEFNLGSRLITKCSCKKNEKHAVICKSLF